MLYSNIRTMTLTAQRLIILLIVFIIAQTQQNHNHTIYHIIPSYQEYQAKFKQKAGPNNTYQKTSLGTGFELCERRLACRFYTYLHEPEDKQKIKYNVLITSGMHGNELIGPTTLLYLYQLLKPKDTRIIYFPICNPSGYNLKQRHTYPNNLDLNRDFPIDDNTKCYRGSSTRIIDKIFRQYKIDLTINLHNGADQIGWNWGTKYHAKFPFTEDQPIYSTIGSMLKFIGGYNKRINMLPFQIGTMDDVIYPAEGTLDDWAYAASWVQSVPYKCNDYNYQPYPKNMHQGLVFLFELGEHNAPQNKLGTSQGLNLSSDSSATSNGYVTRAIRMLKSLIKIVSPTVHAQLKQQNLLLKIEGCNKIDSLELELSDKNNPNKKQKFQQILKLSTVKNSFTYIAKFKISNQQLIDTSNLTLFYNISCDKQWNGLGKSFLGRPRIYQDTIDLSNIVLHKQEIMKINGKNVQFDSQSILIGFLTLLVLIIICVIYQNRKKKEIFQKIRKYEPSDSDTSNLNSISQLQSKQRTQNTQIQTVQLSKI